MKSPAPKLILFPVLVCNQKCHYCVNHHGDFDGGLPSNLNYKLSPTKAWVDAITSLEGVEYINWVGGEPGLHPGIAEMIDSCKDSTQIVVGTNGSKLSVSRIVNCRRRDNLWIQISFHPTQVTASQFCQSILPIAQKFSGRMGVHSPDHICKEDALFISREIGVIPSQDRLITSPDHGGSMIEHESTRSPMNPKSISCPINYWVPVAPNGDIYACHGLMYAQTKYGVIGNLFSGEWDIKERFNCNQYGRCNPCDVSRFVHEHETMEFWNRRKLV